MANEPPAAQRVVVVSHSPFVYLWPVWAVGFLMAGLTYAFGHQVAFVPPGTVAERDGRVDGYDGRRDVLIAPAGRPLPEAPEQFGVKQPRLRMLLGNDGGIFWALTLCLTLVATHVQIRRTRSMVVVVGLLATAVLLSVLGWWDAIVRAIRILEIHITATGYLSISLLLLIAWAVIYWVFDRQMRMVFTPGQVRVRTASGAGETVYDTHGVTVKLNREALIRHWVLGFGSGDLTITTAGANPMQFEWPNVMRAAEKLREINSIVVQPEVVRAQ